MNKQRFSAQVLLIFLLITFLVISGCSKSDDTPPPAPTTYSITGTVTGSAQALGTVVITLTNVSAATTSTATTATDGTYSFTGLANGTYTLAPALTGYVFDPNPITVVVNGSNMVQNFVSATNPGGTTYSISGTVYLGPSTTTAVSGVTVTLAGAHTGSVVTGSTGTWTFTGLLGGNYTVTASLSGYSITPVSFTWNPLAANSSGNIFYATLAKFSQADLVGTWNVRMLKSASSGGWKHAVITLDTSGILTGATDCLDNTGDTTCPGVGNVTWTINTSTGVITETGSDAGSNVHMTMASNKTFIAGTEDNSKLLIAQKEVTGTSYAAADVQSKNFVFHQFNVGSSQKWQYGTGTSSSVGAINISSQTDPVSGTTAPGDVGATISVDSSGVVSMSDNDTWKGFLSADKKTIVGTDTESAGAEFHMLIIQITNGQSSSTSQVAGISYDHILATGASPAPFWAHQSMTITSGGVITYNGDWVDSNSGTGPTGPETISIGSSGAATLAGSAIQETSFNGQLSYDGKFMVATQTLGTGVYSLNIITQ